MRVTPLRSQGQRVWGFSVPGLRLGVFIQVQGMSRGFLGEGLQAQNLGS